MDSKDMRLDVSRPSPLQGLNSHGKWGSIDPPVPASATNAVSTYVLQSKQDSVSPEAFRSRRLESNTGSQIPRQVTKQGRRQARRDDNATNYDHWPTQLAVRSA